MNNGDGPKLQVVFSPDGMHVKHNLNPQQLGAVASMCIQMMLQPPQPAHNPLLIPKTQVPPDLRGN